MEREVGVVTVRPFILDHAVAGPIKALSMARTVGIASHSSSVMISVTKLTHAEKMATQIHQIHNRISRLQSVHLLCLILIFQPEIVKKL